MQNMLCSQKQSRYHAHHFIFSFTF